MVQSSEIGRCRYVWTAYVGRVGYGFLLMSVRRKRAKMSDVCVRGAADTDKDAFPSV